MSRSRPVLVSFLAAASLVACGGSGVPGGKRLTSLDAADRTDLCTYIVSTLAEGAAAATCDGRVYSLEFAVDDCVRSFDRLEPTCTLTVNDAERCSEAMAASPCEFIGGVCDAVADCFAEVI